MLFSWTEPCIVACILLQSTLISARHLHDHSKSATKRTYINDVTSRNITHLKQSSDQEATWTAIKRGALKTGNFKIDDGDVTGVGTYEIKQDKVNVDIQLSIQSGLQSISQDNTAARTVTTTLATFSTTTTQKPTEKMERKKDDNDKTLATQTWLFSKNAATPSLDTIVSNNGSTISLIDKSTAKNTSSTASKNQADNTTKQVPTGKGPITHKTPTGQEDKFFINKETKAPISKEYEALLSQEDKVSKNHEDKSTANNSLSLTESELYQSSTTTAAPTSKGYTSVDGSSFPTLDTSASNEEQIQYAAPTKFPLNDEENPDRLPELNKLQAALSDAAVNWAFNLRNGNQRQFLETRVMPRPFTHQNFVPEFDVNWRKQQSLSP